MGKPGLKARVSFRKYPSISGGAGREQRAYRSTHPPILISSFVDKLSPNSNPSVFAPPRLSLLPKKITRKRPQPRKPIPRIHILLDHIKREIIKPAETPDRNRQQHPLFERPLLQYQQRRRQQTDDQKQNSFQFNPPRISQVFHPAAPCITTAAESHAPSPGRLNSLRHVSEPPIPVLKRYNISAGDDFGSWPKYC